MLFSIYNYFLQTDPITYGDWACNLFDRWYNFFPVSDYYLKDLTNSLYESLPFLGKYLIYKILNNLQGVLIIVSFYKLLKVLPGKM